MQRYIPNILSSIRLALIPPFLMFFAQENYVLAFFVFLIAGFTDALDGWLARHFHWQSFWGGLLDPLADKLLIVSSFLALAYLNVLPKWLVILVFLRDANISLGVLSWNYFFHEKIKSNPTYTSKLNTCLQLFLLSICLFELAFFELPSNFKNLCIILTASTTIISYLEYASTWINKAYAAYKKQK